ncbi:hypothetical protein Plhal304r1_c069g0157881 [Plasmopara halstedii]
MRIGIATLLKLAPAEWRLQLRFVAALPFLNCTYTSTPHCSCSCFARTK